MPCPRLGSKAPGIRKKSRLYPANRLSPRSQLGLRHGSSAVNAQPWGIPWETPVRAVYSMLAARRILHGPIGLVSKEKKLGPYSATFGDWMWRYDDIGGADHTQLVVIVDRCLQDGASIRELDWVSLFKTLDIPIMGAMQAKGEKKGCETLKVAIASPSSRVLLLPSSYIEASVYSLCTHMYDKMKQPTLATKKQARHGLHTWMHGSCLA